MYTESGLKKRCQEILEENGGNIADQANKILLEDPRLKGLQSPLEFISLNWRNPLTPSMVLLSCEAVEGQVDAACKAALAMSLMSLSFYVWDDMLDKAPQKLFKPTLFGKFGEGTALVIGGLASAKAFSILNHMDVDKSKRQTVTDLVWILWAKMAQAETVNLQLRSQKISSARSKLWVIKQEAVDLETCLKIGAILGDGSDDEIRHLARYGRNLGIILELHKDFLGSINLTLELTERIGSGALPYSILWAKEHSEKLCGKLEDLANKNTIKPAEIKEIVEYTLETNTLANTLEIIRKSTNKALESLCRLKMNKAARTLKFFVEVQPQLFIESLSALQV